MNNYIKGFIFSFVLHAGLAGAFFGFIAHMDYKPKPRIVIDLSTMLIDIPIDEKPTIPEDMVVEEIPPVPPPPVPPQVVQAPPPRPEPVPEVVPEETYTLGEAEESSVAPVEAEPTPQVEAEEIIEEVTGYAFGDSQRDEAAQVSIAANARRDQELRMGYVTNNFSYIQRHIRNKLIYPPQAKRMGLKGRVTVRFTINSDGSVTDVDVETTSGHEVLDNAGLKAVHAAAPFPKPPIAAQIVIPIDFKLM